jgi:hypothetical protein
MQKVVFFFLKVRVLGKKDLILISGFNLQKDLSFALKV